MGGKTATEAEMKAIHFAYRNTADWHGRMRSIAKFEDCYLARDSDGEISLYALRNPKHIEKFFEPDGFWSISCDAEIDDFDYETISDDVNFIPSVKWSDSEPTKISDISIARRTKKKKEGRRMEEKRSFLNEEEVAVLQDTLERTRYMFPDAKIEEFCFARDEDGAIWMYNTLDVSEVERRETIWYLSGDRQTVVVPCDEGEWSGFFPMLNWEDKEATLISSVLAGGRQKEGWANTSWDDFFCTCSTEDRASIFTNQFGACVGQFCGKFPDDCEALGCKQCWMNFLNSDKLV